MSSFDFLDNIGTEKTGGLSLERGSLHEVLHQFGQKALDLLRDQIDKKNITASASLRQSIKFETRILGDVFSFQLSLNDYYKWVDEGRGPSKNQGKGGKTLVQFLEEWITKKGIKVDIAPARSKQIKSLRNKKVRKGLKQMSIEKKRRSMAFAMARKIHKYGTKPTRFYSSIINEDAINDLKRGLSKALKRDVVIEIRNLTK